MRGLNGQSRRNFKECNVFFSFISEPCGLQKDGWKNFHGHYYIFITTVKTWKDAEVIIYVNNL